MYEKQCLKDLVEAADDKVILKVRIKNIVFSCELHCKRKIYCLLLCSCFAHASYEYWSVLLYRMPHSLY